jgi:hypothetical protein
MATPPWLSNWKKKEKECPTGIIDHATRSKECQTGIVDDASKMFVLHSIHLSMWVGQMHI